ncbi:MAG: hypothetical protein ABR587_11145 [Candidatus Binatia bacterium]
MKARALTIAASFAAAALAMSQPAMAETKTVIEETPGKYTEQRKNADGTESELHINREEGTRVYKDSEGVEIKETIENGKIKQEYKDEDCKRSAQQNIATGDSKVVSEGDCPK